MRILISKSLQGLILAVTSSIWISLFSGTQAGGQESTELEERLDSIGYNAREHETAKILRTSFSANYVGLEYAKIENEIEEKYHVDIVLGQSAMDDLLDVDSKISLEMKNVSLQQGLRLMLAQHNATFFVDNGVIRVISRDDSLEPEYLATRVYNVRKLVKMLAESSSLAELKAAEAKLIEIVTAHCVVDDTEASTVSLFSGLLVVKTTQDLLETTEQLISKLQNQVADEFPGFQSDGQESTLLKNLIIGKGYDAREQKMIKSLGTSFSASYDETDFAKIVKDIEKKYRVDIILNQTAIDDELDVDSEISLEVKGVTLQEGLQVILSQHNAIFYVDDGVIQVISRYDSAAPECLATRVYNVRKLVTMLGDPSSLGESPDVQAAETELIEIVTEQMELDWSEFSSVSMLSGFLIVTTGQQLLESTDLLIANLQEKVADGKRD